MAYNCDQNEFFKLSPIEYICMASQYFASQVENDLPWNENGDVLNPLFLLKGQHEYRKYEKIKPFSQIRELKSILISVNKLEKI